MSFSIADAFVSIRAQADDDSVGSVAEGMGSRLTKWAAGLGLGALISKGLADNIDASNANAKLTAQMGLTKDVASNMGKLSGQVYRDNFGESVEDVNEAIKGVGTNMVDLGSTSKGQIKDMTEAALGLSSTFDLDVNESTKAAGQLMKNGLAKDGKEAFDIITKGMQMGLNSSDDFLDTITEYSPQFTKLGLDGPAALGLLSQGLKAGAKDTDAIADAFKEFSLRSIDGSKTTVDAYKSLGLSADSMAASIAKGGPSAQKATGQVIDALKGVKDPVERNRIGVELFGTQWEDTLRQILPNLDLSKAKLTDVGGATKNMNDTMGNTPTAKIEGLKRQAEGLLQAAVQLPGPFGGLSAAIVGFGPQLLSMGASVALIGPSLVPAITATWAWTAALLANPVTWIVIGIVALVAAIVLIATKTTWFQTIWSAVWGAIKTATSATWDFLKMIVSKGFEFLKTLFLNFTGPGLIIKHWTTIKNATSAAWTWIKDKVSALFNAVRDTISSVAGSISSKISGVWNTIKSVTSSAWTWIKSTITNGINGARSAVSSAVGGIGSSISSIKGKVTGALSGAASFLYNSGQAIIRGLINGIKSMAGSVKSAVSGVLSSARNLLPFSPAKEGPFSGKGWTEYSGASLMQGLATGINNSASMPINAMDSALTGVSVAAAPGIPAQATSAGGTYNITVNLDGTMDLTKPAQARSTAKALVKEMALALRDQEKERR
ncbi:phage tail tape measure protein [Streptomyces sp. NBC_01239]|uniref:phage tail tape measure protein n=1 Tax=Streptomyces sp. NBC_01239 TaxID=2903792 RepID=UPI0022539BFA|nr:phage tail tape measure protein [Streptomyces sp. NBC_01239]MCX4813692.1 phage tail tape measure protein [Streptomyces sp. NBC_01239]